MTQEEVISKSKIVTEKLLNSEWFKNSNTIMSYISIKNEIDLQEINETIIKLGKTLVLPVIDNNGENMKSVRVDTLETLKEKKFGVREPDFGEEIKYNEIDLVIVPGVAFDINGNRIGFGKGYYDRFLRG